MSLFKEVKAAVTLEMEHRLRVFRMNFMAEDTSTGMVQAFLDGFKDDYVCTKLLYNECYHMLGEPDRKNIGEINDIMNNTIEGWIPGPQHRFDRYGQQRSWVRVKRPDKRKADSAETDPLPDGEYRQLDLAGKHQIVIDGIPYTAMVFFRTDTRRPE